MHARAGFRAVLRQPAVILGEIAWRWAFGAAAWALLLVSVHRILARVDMTRVELLIARRSDIFLIADACARVLVQVLPQLARECLVLVPAICVLWVIAATVGRAATLKALMAGDGGARLHFGQLIFLHVARAVFTLAAITAFFGAMLLAGSAMPTLDPTAAAVAWIFLAGLVAFFWSVVNWFLALAPIWMVRDGQPALMSVVSSVNLSRSEPGAYVAIGWWFGLLRGLALVVATVVALMAGQAPPASAIAWCVVVALVYLAAADFLYIARLAAFVALDENSQVAAISSQPITPDPQPIAAPEL